MFFLKREREKEGETEREVYSYVYVCVYLYMNAYVCFREGVCVCINGVILVMCAHACAFMWTHESQNMPDVLLAPMSLLFLSPNSVLGF